MTNTKFIDVAKQTICDYFNKDKNPEKEALLTKDDIYVVWICKTLQNHKGLLSTTVPDGMYYECTYNGDKEEMYFDAYQKVHNEAIPIGVGG